MKLAERNISEQMTLFEPKEVVRPDLNIAKWAGFLFSSPWAKDLHEEKSLTYTSSDGVKSSIDIIPARGRKRPTTTTQKVLYALIQIWEEEGRPANGEFYFSARQLAHMLNWKWSGSVTGKKIQEHLAILKSTSIDWKRSFYKGTRLETFVSEMNILSDKSYLVREDMINTEYFHAQHKVELHKSIVYNMIQGKTKPFNYKTFISIKNDASAKLYNLVDTFLSVKSRWERRSFELLTDDLELAGKRYKELKIRHQRLKQLVNELDGKPLSTGVLKLSIGKTADGKDYKLIATKKPGKRLKSPKRLPSKIANPKEQIPWMVSELMQSLENLGSFDPEKSQKIIEHLAHWYSYDMLSLALARVKVDYQGNIKTSPVRVFMYQVHVMAHERGLEWIKDCGPDCKHRPENRQQMTFLPPSDSHGEPQNDGAGRPTEADRQAEEKAAQIEQEAREAAERFEAERKAEAAKQAREKAIDDFLAGCDDAKMAEILADFEQSDIFTEKIGNSLFAKNHYQNVGVKDPIAKRIFRQFVRENYFN